MEVSSSSWTAYAYTLRLYTHPTPTPTLDYFDLNLSLSSSSWRGKVKISKDSLSHKHKWLHRKSSQNEITLKLTIESKIKTHSNFSMSWQVAAIVIAALKISIFREVTHLLPNAECGMSK